MTETPNGMPEMNIPGTPDVTMRGITAQYRPTLIKCCLGGWIVIVDEGIASFTHLKEAGDFMVDHAFVMMGEEKPPKPKFMEREKPYEEEKSLIGRMRSTLQAFVWTVLVVMSVRMS